MEERLTALEREIVELKTTTAIKEAAFEKQKQCLLDYIEKEFAISKLAINEVIEGAKTKFAAERKNLQVLYEATTLELVGIKAKVEKFESSTHGHILKDQGRLIAAKQMSPRVLEKPEDWKTWRREIQDYCDVVKDGMKDALEEVRGLKDEVGEEHLDTKW